MAIADVLLLAPVAAWVVVAAIACYGLYDTVSTLKPAPTDRTDLRPALIIPVRGVPAHFAALWQAIGAQTLPPRRVIFAIESTDDPACKAIESLAGKKEIVVAGPTAMRGQKIHNQLAAFGVLNEDDNALVLADADILPAADWLARLVIPLNDPQVQLVSGYRWMTPSDDRWSSALICVGNASVATLPRLPLWNLAWGGSIAMRRQTFEALDLPRTWKHGLVDDLSLTVAIWARGAPVTAPQSLLVPSPTSLSLTEGIAFARRQYLFVRWYTPRYWCLAAAATTVPLIGWIFAVPLALAGNRVALAAILLANALDILRGSLRGRVPRILWNRETPWRMAVLDRFATPLWLAVHAGVVWSTAFGRRMTWAGRIYTLDRDNNVIRIDPAA